MFTTNLSTHLLKIYCFSNEANTNDRLFKFLQIMEI